MISTVSPTIQVAQITTLVSKVKEAIQSNAIKVEADFKGDVSEEYKATIEIECDADGVHLIMVEAEINTWKDEETSRYALVKVIHVTGYVIAFPRAIQDQFNELAKDQLTLVA